VRSRSIRISASSKAPSRTEKTTTSRTMAWLESTVIFQYKFGAGDLRALKTALVLVDGPGNGVPRRIQTVPMRSAS
jgi:hypothetical protein